MSIVEHDGVALYYEVAGSGAPVVFVHGGLPSLALALRNLEPFDWTWEWDFAQQFHFIWYDRRGCYRSACPDDGYDVATQAVDLDHLLNHLGLESTHLIGSSAGGPIAILFAATRPHRIRSLVLVGTGLELFPVGDKPSDLLREHLRLLEQYGPETAFAQRPAGVEATVAVLWEREEAAAQGTLQEWLESQRRLAPQVESISQAERIRWYRIELQSIQAYMEADLRGYAQQVTSPTLVLHGGADRTVPMAWGRELAQTIPSAQFQIIAGGPHGLLFRNAAARRTVIDFMQSVDAGSANNTT